MLHLYYEWLKYLSYILLNSYLYFTCSILSSGLPVLKGMAKKHCWVAEAIAGGEVKNIEFEPQQFTRYEFSYNKDMYNI